MTENMLMSFQNLWHNIGVVPEIMKMFFFIVSFFVALSFSAQIESSTIFIDFGSISKGDERIKEITLTNKNSIEESIVKIGANENEFDVKFSQRSFAPGASVLIRIKYNPKTKGPKEYDIPIYFSKTESLVIKLKADVNYLEWEDYTPCPDFSNTKRSNNFSVIFKVVDSINGEPIKGATVAIAQQSTEQGKWTSNKNGEVEQEIPLGYYTMLGRAEGYTRSRKEGYINRRNRYFIFALDPIEQEETNIIGDENEEIEVKIVVETREDEKAPEIVMDVLSGDIQKVDENPDFSLNKYLRNNVVFLIDVSTSMKKENRLEILKSSMIELLGMLRSEDRLSIITYSSSSDVVMNSVPVSDKRAIEKVISDLQGKGLTAGGTGIKKAYSIAQKNFIDGGNNQVYLATDGAFNKGENDVSRFVKKQKRKGVYMSIIAVKSPIWTIPKMKEICNQSNGDYIAIDDFEMDKEKLKEIVKQQSEKILQ